MDRRRSPKEIEIEQKLKTPVSLQFTKAPLHEVVDYLSARKPGVREFHVVDEDVRFGLPHELLELARVAGKPLASGAPTSG